MADLPPGIVITDPEDGDSITAPTLTVSGEVSDPDGLPEDLDEDNFDIWIEGQNINWAISEYEESTGDWTAIISNLDNGDYTIAATVYDRGYSSETDTAEVTIDLPLPDNITIAGTIDLAEGLFAYEIIVRLFESVEMGMETPHLMEVISYDQSEVGEGPFLYSFSDVPPGSCYRGPAFLCSREL